MSNRKVISMMAAGDDNLRAERAQIELEWYRAIREFRGKLEQLQARLEVLEAGYPRR